MKFKLLCGVLATIGMIGCSAKPPEGHRKIAFTADTANCAGDFTEATQRFLALVKAHRDIYGAFSEQDLARAVAITDASCTQDKLAPYGFAVSKSAKAVKITVEGHLQSVVGLFESDLGRGSMQKYKVEERYVTFNRILVAVAAHAYADALGIDDSQYALFFQTLAAMDRE